MTATLGLRLPGVTILLTCLIIVCSAIVAHEEPGMKLKTDALAGFIVCHLLALLAFAPWFFSWTGVVLLIVGMYVFGVVGINLGFHRLLTHRSFSCPLWLEHTLAVLGTCCLQFSPAFWVAVHRRHHHFADEEQDPHSPLKSFFWAHFGWLLVRPPDMKPRVMMERYARDVVRDPLYAVLDRKKNWIKLTLLSWMAFLAAGFAASALSGASTQDSLQFGSSLFVWGGALRTVVVWHTTWAVNSVTHVWGYRNYDTPDDSRNNVIVGLLAGGEGWHNNHHAAPTSARHGHNWWEFDLAWQTIRLLMLLGLATKVSLPSPNLAGRRLSVSATLGIRASLGDPFMLRRCPAIALFVLLSTLAIGGVSAQEPKKPARANPLAVGTPASQSVNKAGGATGAELNKKQMEVVQRVNLYFNQLSSLKGTFIQTSADGKRLRGKFYVNRPGRFRFDYARPSMLVIVSDGKYVAIQDHDLGTDDRWGLEHTPFQMLLRKDVDLLRDARFFEVQDSDDAIAITLEDKGADSSSRIKLVLAKKPTLELREWIAKDVQGLDTRIVLGDVVKTDDLDPTLFNPASVTLQRQR